MISWIREWRERVQWNKFCEAVGAVAVVIFFIFIAIMYLVMCMDGGN